MSAFAARSPISSLATVLYVIAVAVSIAVTLRLVLFIFLEPGDTLGFMFSVLETKFLPSTLTVVFGCWSVAVLRLPPVWLRLLCVPMAAWGVYALMGFLAK